MLARWEPLGVQGRVYVAREGVNAQLAVPSTTLGAFEASLASWPALSGVWLNKDGLLARDEYEARPPFRALHVRFREQIVADGFDDDADGAPQLNLRGGNIGDAPTGEDLCGRDLRPDEWQSALDRGDAVVLDCRNDYESAVGAFATATALNTSTFRDTWSALDGALAGVDKSKPVLMYCTGGIRCVKAGAYVRQALGFENVGRLEGGIVNYLN